MGKPKGPALLAWTFTYMETVNNELAPAKCIVAAFEKLNATHYAFQNEKGTKTGRLHWQGNVKFKKPITGPELRKAFKAAVRQSGEREWIYYGEGCLTTQATHDLQASTIYSLKEETRVEGSTQYIFPKNYYLGQDLMPYETMYPWQKSVFDIVMQPEPDPRAIHCIVDPIGLNGKSTLAKKLGYQYGACVVPLGLTSAQMKSAIVGNGPKDIYIIDLPRNNKSYTEIFDTIEEIKRGFVISCFHGHLKELYMARPHIVCFTNVEPDLSYLSMDMWRIYSISAKEQALLPQRTFEVHRLQQLKRASEKKNTNGSFRKGSLEDV